MKAADVASVVGCTPSYISQLWQNEEFRGEVEALATANAKEKTEEEHLDGRYQNLEHKIINNIEKELPHAELPMLVRALEVVGKRQTEIRKSKLPALAPIGPSVNVNITSIALPAHMAALPVPIVQTNENNEIIAIDNKPLAPMSSEGVKNIFQQIKERKAAAKSIAMADAAIVAEI